jgi:hypothetical protein
MIDRKAYRCENVALLRLMLASLALASAIGPDDSKALWRAIRADFA